MATYAQWRKAADQDRVKRVTWVCGPEPVLVDEVTDLFILKSRGGDFRTVQSFVAGEHSEQGIWEECFSVPGSGERRLVIVREAQRLEDMANAALLADRHLADVWVLFVSSDAGYDRKLPKERGGGREMFPGPAAVHALNCGQVVKCLLATEADKLAWLKRRIPGIETNPALAVLEKSGQDLTVVADVALKVAAARWPVSEAALLELVADRKSAAEFEDDLIYHRKKDALAHLPKPDDYGRVFALLGSRLDVLSQLWEHRDATARELEMNARIPRMFVAAYRKAVPHYPPVKVRDCRQLLATLDVAWRHGACTGLGEALVAMW